MRALETPTVRIVIYEGSGAHPLPADERFGVMRSLLDRGLTVTCTAPAPAPGRAASSAGGAFGAVATVAESTLLVLGRFEGPPPELADAAGEVAIHLRDIGGLDAPGIAALVDQLLSELQLETNRPGRWKPWFPVIDYSRCTNCMQCLSFCLFNVYGVDAAKRIQVQHNDNCKTDCPACSRVCPEVAIMFPKYNGGPINGDVVRDADLKREAMKIDISALLGGDIYSTLKQRHADASERFSKERDEKRAISERMRCLTKLAGQMDIPMEVLKSLPSQDEIRAKAEAARQRAEAALEKN